MSLKLVCEMNEETRWIAVLLGPEVSSEKNRIDVKNKNI